MLNLLNLLIIHKALWNESLIKCDKGVAAVSCSPSLYDSGGAGLGIWLTGKLGCAWVVVVGKV